MQADGPSPRIALEGDLLKDTIIQDDLESESYSNLESERYTNQVI